MNIIVFGDSVHHGAWDLKNGGWVNLLKMHVEKNSGYEDELYNLSIDGDDSRGLLKRIYQEIKPRLADRNVIILSIGTNDSYFFGDNEKRTNTSGSEYRRNINKIIHITKKYTDTVVFVGLEPQDDSRVQPVPWNPEISYSLKNIIRFNNLAKEVCKKEKVLFLDIMETLLKLDYKKLLADGTHPNTKGHKIIFELVLNFLKEEKILK
ncbi:MAG: hypothetical protein HY514_01645 [Candidatus Aenigmarchaeota archaeon]|nr:hypothetical protein [Candidatus Aenigmarchaeota archaeon]